MSKFMFPNIETERLELRVLTLEDSEEVYNHFSDEAITKYMDINPCQDINEAMEIIQFHINDTGCRWGVFDRTDNKLIGTCGFHCWTTKNEPKAEIGFDLSKSFWGKGLMNEAIQPIMEFGFKYMGLEIIEATVDPKNVKSIQLLNRLGFNRSEELLNNLLYFYINIRSDTEG